MKMKNIFYFCLGFLLVAGYAAATTTISTNINSAGSLTIGADGAGTDATFYTDTAGEELLWDASENQLTLDGANGTTALAVTDGNVVITDNFTTLGTATIGADGSGTDVTFYTDTAGEELLWDASENQLIMDGTDQATALAVTDGKVVITDQLTVTGTSTFTGGYQTAAVSMWASTTPVALASTDGFPVPLGARFISVKAKNNANDWINLPAYATGTRVSFYIDATGYEIRAASSTEGFRTKINNGTPADASESAIPANTLTECLAAGNLNWFCTDYNTAGVASTTQPNSAS